MRPQLLLHGSRVCAVGPPRLGPQLLGLTVGLGMAFLFGAVATMALTGEPLPRLIRLSGQDHSGIRWVALAMGTVNFLLSVLVASGFAIKAYAIFSHRMGWGPIMESEGPCRLVQDAPGLWGLQMELAEGTDPGVLWPLTTDRHSQPACHLFFRLDEAAAGAVSHLTDPDEHLVVRWLDFAPTLGGPTLLEVRTPAREILAGEVATETRRAA